MWGPGDAGPTASGRLFLAVARGELSAVPRAGSHTADARDVARAAIAAISRGTHARRYIVAAPWQPLPAITAQIAAATGAPAPRQVTAALAMAGSAVIELAARLRRRQPAVTRAGTQVLLEGDHQHLTTRRAERELAVTYRPLAQTIADETAWYRGHGMLPPGQHSPCGDRRLRAATPGPARPAPPTADEQAPAPATASQPHQPVLWLRGRARHAPSRTAGISPPGAGLSACCSRSLPSSESECM
jgi:hypothetical protein